MAKIPKSGIASAQTIQASHITNIIKALDGTGSYEIDATGSFTGSFSGSFSGDGSGLTGVDTNFANTNLSLTGTRFHDLNGFDLTIAGGNAGIYLDEATNTSQVGQGSNYISVDNTGIILYHSLGSRMSFLAGTTVINEAGTSANLRVESDTNPNMLLVDGGLNRVSIGKSSPNSTLDVNGDTTITGSVNITGGVTASSYTGSFVGDGTGLTGVADTTFANTDLTFTADRTHELNGRSLTIQEGSNQSINMFQGFSQQFVFGTSYFEQTGTYQTFVVNNVTQLDLGSAGAIFNNSGADLDFRVESDTNPNMLFVDGGTNRVGIGKSAPNSVLDVNGSAIISGSLTLQNNDIIARNLEPTNDIYLNQNRTIYLDGQSVASQGIYSNGFGNGEIIIYSGSTQIEIGYNSVPQVTLTNASLVVSGSITGSAGLRILGGTFFGTTAVNGIDSHYFRGISGKTNMFAVRDADGEDVITATGVIASSNVTVNLGDVSEANNGTIVKIDDGAQTVSLGDIVDNNNKAKIIVDNSVTNGLTTITGSVKIHDDRTVAAGSAETVGQLVTNGSRVRNYRVVEIRNGDYSIVPSDRILPTDDIILIDDQTTGAGGIGEANFGIKSLLQSVAGRCVELVYYNKAATAQGAVITAFGTMAGLDLHLNGSSADTFVMDTLGQHVTIMSTGDTVAGVSGSAWGNGYTGV